MSFIEILIELWRRRWAVLAGVAIATGVALVVHGNNSSLQYSTARSQVLVDSPASSIADLNRDLNPLIARASIFSRLLTSPAALQQIGVQARIDPREIFAQGPVDPSEPRSVQEPTADTRGGQLIGERSPYRLLFQSTSGLPIVTIYAQAPTTAGAIRLADGAARGLSTYIQALQDQQQIPALQRVRIRQLGPAYGSVVDPGTNTRIALLAWLGIVIFWCAALLIGTRLVRNWRIVSAQEHDAAPTADPVGRSRDAAPGADPVGDSHDDVEPELEAWAAEDAAHRERIGKAGRERRPEHLEV